FRETFRADINDALIECFEQSGLSKADIARKLGRRPEQVTRWLSAPCNLEIDTVADLALAFGMMPKIRLDRVGAQRSNQQCHRLVWFIERSADTLTSYVGLPSVKDSLGTAGETTITRYSPPSERILIDA